VYASNVLSAVREKADGPAEATDNVNGNRISDAGARVDRPQESFLLWSAGAKVFWLKRTTSGRMSSTLQIRRCASRHTEVMGAGSLLKKAIIKVAWWVEHGNQGRRNMALA